MWIDTRAGQPLPENHLLADERQRVDQFVPAIPPPSPGPAQSAGRTGLTKCNAFVRWLHVLE